MHNSFISCNARILYKKFNKLLKEYQIKHFTYVAAVRHIKSKSYHLK